MKVISLTDIKDTEREVHCPHGGFTSFRFLLAKDGMGFSMHKTVIPRGDAQHWHYKNHLEACYCVAGAGILQNLQTGEKHWIFPDTVYVLDNHDDHNFQAIEDTVLISVFNPPVAGGEVHDADGSYRMENGHA
jgi:L-ectoine synthase